MDAPAIFLLFALAACLAFGLALARPGATRARRWLSGRRALALALAGGVLVNLPSLGAGLHPEDAMLRAQALHGPTAARRWLDLFAWTGGGPGDALLARSLGATAWWAPEQARSALARPLSSITHHLDFALLDGAPWAMHAESIAIYAALVAVVWALYRAVEPRPAVAGVAAILYAVDWTHTWTVGWLANRNALVAGALALAGVVVHARRVRAARPARAAWLGPLLFALGLAGGEAALAALGYLVAHALVIDERPWRARLRSVAPYLVIALAWAALYRAAGYGVRGGSALYVDPGERPLAFAHALAVRLPDLLALGITGQRAAALRLPTPVAALAWLALAAAVVLGARALAHRRSARFFALSALLAAVPLSAGPVGERQLLLPGVGIVGFVAVALVAWLPAPGDEAGLLGRAGVRAALALPWAVLASTHALFGPLLAIPGSASVGAAREALAAQARTLFAGAEPGARIRVVRGPDLWGCTLHVATARELGVPNGASAMCLSGGPAAIEVEREGPRTLVLRAAPSFVAGEANRVNWDETRPMRPGQTIPLTDMDVTVDSVDADGEPTVATFRTHDDLDAAPARWRVWNGAAYVPFTLPAIGARVRLP